MWINAEVIEDRTEEVLVKEKKVRVGVALVVEQWENDDHSLGGRRVAFKIYSGDHYGRILPKAIDKAIKDLSELVPLMKKRDEEFQKAWEAQKQLERAAKRTYPSEGGQVRHTGKTERDREKKKAKVSEGK